MLFWNSSIRVQCMVVRDLVAEMVDGPGPQCGDEDGRGGPACLDLRASAILEAGPCAGRA